MCSLEYCITYCVYFFFFFFQAEDGIRDPLVTGVQTCALPIFRTARAKGLSERAVLMRHAMRGGLLPVVSFSGPALAFLVTGTVVVERLFALRSEERRVGKECRSRWSAEH